MFASVWLIKWQHAPFVIPCSLLPNVYALSDWDQRLFYSALLLPALRSGMHQYLLWDWALGIEVASSCRCRRNGNSFDARGDSACGGDNEKNLCLLKLFIRLLSLLSSCPCGDLQQICLHQTDWTTVRFDVHNDAGPHDIHAIPVHLYQAHWVAGCLKHGYGFRSDAKHRTHVSRRIQYVIGNGTDQYENFFNINCNNRLFTHNSLAYGHRIDRTYNHHDSLHV